jgi:hypothetical protein
VRAPGLRRPPGAALKQVTGATFKSVSQAVQIVYAEVALASLDCAHIGPVEVRQVSQLLLGDPSFPA